MDAPVLPANHPGRRDDRFNIRATGREKALLARAAELARMSTSQFVLRAAVVQAEEVLADQTRFELPSDKWDSFVEAMDRPEREIPALRRATEKPSPFSER